MYQYGATKKLAVFKTVEILFYDTCLFTSMIFLLMTPHSKIVHSTY